MIPHGMMNEALNLISLLRFSKESVGSEHKYFLKCPMRASLVAQWLRIRLPMQGTRV